MQLSINWLKSYMDLSDITPAILRDKLTSAGLEVERIEQGSPATGLTIGLVLTCNPHPDSDHLKCTTVDVGSTVLSIVCGAPNVAAGQKVIVAMDGAVLPQIVIKKSVIRGQQSEGMICSLSEIGVDASMQSEAQLAGIEVLSKDAPIGGDPLAFLGLDDTILEISLTPNRSDCYAMWPLAKEIGAILDRPVTLPDCEGAADIGGPTSLKVASEAKGCPTFLGKVIGSVTLKPSPDWIVKALHSYGVKSINNVVDISNLVMLETGQPTHFYDKDKIPLRQITVKDNIAADYTALDGNTYSCTPGDLMITTGDKLIGFAGIMGGDDSKILDTTTGIIIEVASFDRVHIRRTSRRLGLQTEAAVHYQRVMEPLTPYKAMDRCVALLLQYADAKEIEATAIYGIKPSGELKLLTDEKFHNKLLGTNFSLEEITDVFRRLDFKPVVKGSQVELTIPSYRSDISIQPDLSEEIIRLLGFENITSTLPVLVSKEGGLSLDQKKREKIKDVLTGYGLQEVINYSLVNRSFINHPTWELGEAVELANPLSEERRYYRTSVLPSLISTALYQLDHYQDEFALFEIGDVYYEPMEKQERLSIILSSNVDLSLWQKAALQNDFYRIKGMVAGVLSELGFGQNRVFFKENIEQSEYFHPGQSAAIYLDKTFLGVCGMLHPKLEIVKQAGALGAAELDLSAIFSAKASAIRYQPIPRYPGIQRDLALLIPQSQSAGALINAIYKTGGKLVEKAEVFDLYTGKGVPDGQKSLAIRISYQSYEKTLVEAEIDVLTNTIIERLQRDFQAQIRS
ncbi:MAG: phenylalanine--tRNA ligase subunit beta [Erysipelotrichaceae bacterium]|jgi:phenylalanyl-tRNA synthetase beta chain|nr:phenylalanine--tRNA ligase subunit beta [Erysipelotrichaceae bacterium]